MGNLSLKRIGIIYSVLGFVGFLLYRIFATDALFSPFAFPGDYFVEAAILSVTTIVLVVALSTVTMLYTKSGARCAAMIRNAFGQLSVSEQILIALFSGIGEELLFRAWLLNETGLFISSLVFGLVHVPPNRDWALWPVFAFVIGLILGAFCLYTNTILWAIVIHVGINAVNLHLIYRLNRGIST